MKYNLSPGRRASGFSLIELMVSVLISLIVLAGVVQVVFSSKRAYLDNQDIAYVQDNQRYVMDIISREIRLAGYKGCAADGATVTSDIKKDVLQDVLGVAGDAGFLPLQGYEGSDTALPGLAEFSNREDNTDSLMVWHGGVTQDAALLAHNPAGTTFTVNSAVGFEANQPMMIVDVNCQHVGIFTASTVSTSAASTGVASTGSIGYASTGNNNCSSELKSGTNCDPSPPAIGSKKFSVGSRVIPYVAAGYFIGRSSVTTANMPALKRLAVIVDGGNLVAKTEEIAQGVSDMQIKYGEVTGAGAGATFIYSDANDVGNWNNVVTAQLTLTFRSAGGWKLADGTMMTKTLTSTIQIRNRI